MKDAFKAGLFAITVGTTLSSPTDAQPEYGEVVDVTAIFERAGIGDVAYYIRGVTVDGVMLVSSVPPRTVFEAGNATFYIVDQEGEAIPLKEYIGFDGPMNYFTQVRMSQTGIITGQIVVDPNTDYSIFRFTPSGGLSLLPKYLLDDALLRNSYRTSITAPNNTGSIILHVGTGQEEAAWIWSDQLTQIVNSESDGSFNTDGENIYPLAISNSGTAAFAVATTRTFSNPSELTILFINNGAATQTAPIYSGDEYSLGSLHYMSGHSAFISDNLLGTYNPFANPSEASGLVIDSQSLSVEEMEPLLVPGHQVFPRTIGGDTRQNGLIDAFTNSGSERSAWLRTNGGEYVNIEQLSSADIDLQLFSPQAITLNGDIYTRGLPEGASSTQRPRLYRLEAGAPTMKVFYINGILTSCNAAAQDAVALERLFESELNTIPAESFDVELLYNPNETGMRDLAEAIQQRTGLPIYDIIMFFGTESEEMPDELNQAALDAYVDEVREIRSHPGVLDEMVERVRMELQSHDRVLIIGYSQGNLFANEIVRSFRNSSNVADQELTNRIIVQAIATPDRVVENGGKYTTEKFDLVIVVVRSLVSETLAHNESNPISSHLNLAPDGRNFWGHSLMFRYLLDDTPTEHSIVESFRQSIDGFRFSHGADNDRSASCRAN